MSHVIQSINQPAQPASNLSSDTKIDLLMKQSDKKIIIKKLRKSNQSNNASAKVKVLLEFLRFFFTDKASIKVGG